MMNIHLLYFFKQRLLKLINSVALCFILFFAFIGIVNSAISEGYQVTQVEAEPYTQVIQRSGKLDFARVVNLSFKTSGFLTKLNVDEGDVFKQNQILAALDTSELVAEKNASYARLLQAKRNIDRVKTLMKKNMSSQRDLDDALTSVETTRAAYRVARYHLEKSQIFAPFDGVVIRRNTDLGELQTPGNRVLQVATLNNNLVVRVSLTGDEISLVKLNQNVKVNLAYSGLVDGKISKIPAIADSNTHLFTIEVSLTDGKLTESMIAGQLAKILIHAQVKDFVYRLPIEALNAVDSEGQALVTLERNNKPVVEAFTIYKMDNNFIYLAAHNLSDSLRVITQGWNKLSIISTNK